MTESRIGTEGLPPLPDDNDAAEAAVQSAEKRLSEARQSQGWLDTFVDSVRDMRLHNGFGPRLEEAYRLRSR